MMAKARRLGRNDLARKTALAMMSELRTQEENNDSDDSKKSDEVAANSTGGHEKEKTSVRGQSTAKRQVEAILVHSDSD
jgi:hypothetical protein